MPTEVPVSQSPRGRFPEPAVASPAQPDTLGDVMDVSQASALPVDDVLRRLAVTGEGLSSGQAERRLARFGSNAVSSHRARFALVLWHQLRSPLLGLLLAA